MTKKQVRKVAKEKLREINALIDSKILDGKSFKLEAMIHAGLVRVLA